MEWVEHQGEHSHEDLHVQVKELEERGHRDKWTIFDLATRMEQMEARMNLLQPQVMTVALAPLVNLMREEEEIVGGPIELGSLFLYRTPSPLKLDEVTAEAIEALGKNWELLNTGDVTTSGDYTPTGPCRQSPKL